VSEYEEAREAFRRKWGFDPAPAISDAFRRGEFDLEGGTEDERAFVREVLSGAVGNCAHCGQPVKEERLLEFVTSDLAPPCEVQPGGPATVAGTLRWPACSGSSPVNGRSERHDNR